MPGQRPYLDDATARADDALSGAGRFEAYLAGLEQMHGLSMRLDDGRGLDYGMARHGTTLHLALGERCSSKYLSSLLVAVSVQCGTAHSSHSAVPTLAGLNHGLYSALGAIVPAHPSLQSLGVDRSWQPADSVKSTTRARPDRPPITQLRSLTDARVDDQADSHYRGREQIQSARIAS